MLPVEAPPLERSYNPSLCNSLSFSAYHDTQDSSLAPFHDSWVAQQSSVNHRAERHTHPPPSGLAALQEASPPTSSPPHTLPEMPNITAEHTFTQFGILHPEKEFGPSSTPRHCLNPGMGLGVLSQNDDDDEGKGWVVTAGIRVLMQDKRLRIATYM